MTKVFFNWLKFDDKIELKLKYLCESVLHLSVYIV